MSITKARHFASAASKYTTLVNLVFVIIVLLIIIFLLFREGENFQKFALTITTTQLAG